MTGRRGANGGGLRQGIDSEVYAVVLKLLDDPAITNPTVPVLYQAIQRSNSSLRRRPKKLIEDSLERVLNALADEASDSEAEVQVSHDKVVAKDVSQHLNKSLTSAWKTAKPKVTETEPQQVNGDSESKTPSQTDTKRKRKRDAEADSNRPRPSPPSTARFEDLGGIDGVLSRLKNIIVMPLLQPQMYTDLGMPLPRGVLLHGPPGCGKSVLARAFAAEIGVPLIEIAGPSVVSGMSGESEKQVRSAFDEAKKAAPCILFIDEIDVIAPKRESSQSQMEKRIVAQLLISMDQLELEHKAGNSEPVIVLAATNRPDSIDPALRRGGRFDTEINMGVPNEKTRAQILQALTKNTPLDADVDFPRLARMTAGFVGADLRDLVGKAGAHCLDLYQEALIEQAIATRALTAPRDTMDVDQPPASARLLPPPDAIRLLAQRLRDTTAPRPPGFTDIHLGMTSFLTVLPAITPSSKREGFATTPDITWADVGALHAVREDLELLIVDPILHPERFDAFRAPKSAGVLLWGPPGCGKTLLAKAVAAESQANFISVKGPELLNKFVGESERAIRTVFTRARSSVPCIIFFDEIDALTPRRDGDGDGGAASSRVVNTLLTELDGLDARDDIHVIAATNRPDIIDDAMLRSGRLTSMLYVGPPGPRERGDIMRALLAGRRSAERPDAWPRPGVVEEWVMGAACERYSGADLGAVLQQACLFAMRRRASSVEMGDFEMAVTKVRPSVVGLERYDALKERFARFGAGG